MTGTSNSHPERSPLRYILPAVGGTVWLGCRASALLLLGLGLTAAVGIVLAGAPVPLAAAVLALTVLTAAVPVAGRAPLGWLPAVSEQALRRLTRSINWAATEHGHDEPPPATALAERPAGWVRLLLPAEYGQLYLHGGQQPGAEAIARLCDRDRGTATVVLDVVGTDRHALLEAAAQDSQLARWGSCLSALAADPRVVRWQWLTHTRPDTRPHPGEPQPHCVVDPTGPDSVLLADYAQLVSAARAAALDHRHLLALTLRSDGGSRHRDVATGLVEQVRDLAGVLLGADLLARPLGPAELGSVLRLLTDPTLPDPTRTDEHRCPGDPRRWSVRSRHAGWDNCRTDDNWHRSYAVTGWPRLALPADWLAPILHSPPPAGTARTLAVHARPVAPQHAARQARAASAKAALDAADRSRLGLSGGGAASAADSLAVTDAAELEAELVAGYRLAHLTAFVTITAPDRARLDDGTAALRTVSVTHRLDLRPLHGQHPHGLVATLPLGRLPGGRR